MNDILCFRPYHKYAKTTWLIISLIELLAADMLQSQKEIKKKNGKLLEEYQLHSFIHTDLKSCVNT